MGFWVKSAGVGTVIAAFTLPLGIVHSRDDTAEAVWLAAHNAERAEFGSRPLEWNGELAQDARRWARKLAREGRIRHAPIDAREGQGENLWMGTRGYFRPEQMIDSFASEKRHFRSGTFPQVSSTGNWADVGHYTQIVWRDTRKVGCALEQGRQFDVLVCRYWPAGNVIGTRIAPQAQLASR
ncbi:MAG: CAP domain-containing protein [Erythrobacter sp.]|nr:CAP domain-containing protein [Erythrobacter sp.]